MPAIQNVVPFLDLKLQYSSIREEVMNAVTRVLDSQHFILGPEVTELEQEIAKYIGVQFGIGCASGSDALVLALMALDIGPGDEVITVPFTFVATAGAISRLRATPVFVDIDPRTYNMDPNLLEAAITPKTKAIIPVHLFGMAADMDPILEIAGRHKIPVIEDAAQSIGAKYKGHKVGAQGAISCFSFFPSKNLGGAGDGGMIATNDASLADRLKVLRVHGSRRKYEYELLGMNSRLDALQAAILGVKLRYLDSWAEARRRNAAIYRSLFSDRGLLSKVQLPVEPRGHHHVYNQFTIGIERRDELRQHMSERGIPTEVYYPFPLHLQPAFEQLGYATGSIPQAEFASKHVLSLPIFAELNEEQQTTVVDAIAGFFSR